MPSKSNQPASSWPEGKPAADLEQFFRCLDASRVLTAEEARKFIAGLPESKRPQTPKALAIELIKAGKLTRYQGQALLQGKIKYLTFGEYIVLDRLGRGGMGEVLKAEHRRMGRTVALKVISSDAMKDADAVRRFQREVQAAARLIHSNIVTAFDASEHEGVHFLVMEYVEGRDLAAIVHDLGGLPVATAVDYIAQAARGLAYAHSKGVVHRDIKPGNLLVDRDGTLKILDMGLARIDLAGAKGDELTSTGQVMGTVDYMAPEQAEDTRSADARADIYSLGCTLYRLLSGQTLYGGESVVKKILDHRGAPIPPLASVCPSAPAALDAAFRKMVAKRPQDRQQTMTDVVLELEHILRTSGPSAPAAPVIATTEVPSDSKLSEFLAGLGGRSSVSPPTVAAKKSETKLSAAMEVTHDFKGSDTSKGLAGIAAAAAASKPPAAVVQPAAVKLKRRSWLARNAVVLLIAASVGGLAVATAGIALFVPKKAAKNQQPKQPTSVASSLPAAVKSAPSTSRTETATVVAPQPAGSSGEWISLFNGQNLYGWLQMGYAGWSVKDGLLTGESAADIGRLMSEREFGDFELELDYRLPAGGNSGVFVRAPLSGQVSGAEFNEVQLLDDPAPKFANVAPQGRNGALYSQLAPTKAPIKKANEWRKLKVRCVGQKIQVALDGVDILDGPLRAGTPARGHLGLQLYAPGVAFRNVRVRELTTVAPGDYALAFDGVSPHEVRIPSLIDDGQGPLIVEAWLRPGKMTDRIGAIVGPGNNNRGARLEMYGNSFKFMSYDRDVIRGAGLHVNIDQSRAIHVAGVRDGTSLRIFVDGKLSAEPPERLEDKLMGRSPGPLSLGFTGGGTHFAGTIDEVRVSKVPRYSQNFTPAQRFEPDKDTLALYHFDEGAGDVLNDSSGNGHQGKIFGAKWVKQP